MTAADQPLLRAIYRRTGQLRNMQNGGIVRARRLRWPLLIGEGVELGEVVDVLGAVLIPEIMEAALLAC
jgi:hypothetical protein